MSENSLEVASTVWTSVILCCAFLVFTRTLHLGFVSDWAARLAAMVNVQMSIMRNKLT
jgi:hypothetical protein